MTKKQNNPTAQEALDILHGLDKASDDYFEALENIIAEKRHTKTVVVMIMGFLVQHITRVGMLHCKIHDTMVEDMTEKMREGILANVNEKNKS
jgi:hypothetical protein